jgi:hypothetical protein
MRDAELPAGPLGGSAQPLLYIHFGVNSLTKSAPSYVLARGEPGSICKTIDFYQFITLQPYRVSFLTFFHFRSCHSLCS